MWSNGLKRLPLCNFNTLVLIISMLASGVLSLYLGQDANWDLKNYHFYNVYALLHGRIGFDYAAAYIQTYLNPLMDFLFYFLVTHLSARWVGFIMGAVHGINLWLIYLIAEKVFRFAGRIKQKILSLACAVTGVYGPGFISELGTVFNDTLLSIFLLGAVLLTIRGLYQDENSPPALRPLPVLFGSILMGFAIGLKLYAAVFGIGMIVALIISARTWRARILTAILWPLGAIAGLLISSGYWMFIMWDKFHSPLFPFYNKIFKSPYYAYQNFADRRFLPKNLTETFLYPFYLATPQLRTSEVLLRDIRYAILYILTAYVISRGIILLIYNKKLTPSPARTSSQTGPLLIFLLTFYVTSYAVWQSMFSIYRYIIVLEALAPILIALIVLHTFKGRLLRTLIITSLLLAIVYTSKIPNWGRVFWKDDFFGVKIPLSEQTEYTGNPLVLLDGKHALGYMIPFFNPDFRFVRFKSWFNGPQRKTRLEKEIRALLSRQSPPIYLLCDLNEVAPADTDMRAYGLFVVEKSCRHVSSNLDVGIFLCDVRRVTENASGL